METIKNSLNSLNSFSKTDDKHLLILSYRNKLEETINRLDENSIVDYNKFQKIINPLVELELLIEGIKKEFEINREQLEELKKHHVSVNGNYGSLIPVSKDFLIKKYERELKMAKELRKINACIFYTNQLRILKADN
jgi:hypothetical protein